MVASSSRMLDPGRGGIGLQFPTWVALRLRMARRKFTAPHPTHPEGDGVHEFLKAHGMNASHLGTPAARSISLTFGITAESHGVSTLGKVLGGTFMAGIGAALRAVGAVSGSQRVSDAFDASTRVAQLTAGKNSTGNADGI